MTNLIAQNIALRTGILALLFAMVAIVAYLAAAALASRGLARRRLFEEAPRTIGGRAVTGSLRSEDAESAWLRLVNAIEQRGLNLVDTKDHALRQLLIAAGYSAPFAPRVYTLVRLVLVIGFPLSLMAIFWISGSSPSMVRLYFLKGCKSDSTQG